MAFANERRAFPRFRGDRFLAVVGEETVDVLNISVAGVRIARPGGWATTKGIDFLLIHTSEDAGAAQQIPVRGRVVGADNEHLRISFGAVSSDLAEAIDCFMGDYRHQSASDYAYRPF
jgi:hypothetical protein